MKPLLVRNKGGHPTFLSLFFSLSPFMSSCCSIPAFLLLVTFCHPLVASFFFYLSPHPSANLPTSSSLVFSFPLCSPYPPFHHIIFPASSSLSFRPHLFLSPHLGIHFQRHWLFCNQQGNTQDEKQEKIPDFLSLWLHLVQFCAAVFFLLSAAQQTYFHGQVINLCGNVKHIFFW